MPYENAKSLSADSTPMGHGRAARQKKSEENRMNERLSSQGIRLDVRCLSAKGLLVVPETSSASSQSPATQKFNVLPTPPSTTSAVFDSPQKSSPSSSVSSTYALAIVQRANTPIAELEDTSQPSIYPELEDTSNRAIHSRSATNKSLYAIKSRNSTARYLVSAVDQHFSDYEAEIRYLRNSLAEAERSLREVRTSLREAKEAADNSNHALDAAQEAIADRDYEIQIKKNVITELEKDVKHCQQHHPPPAPPSKWRVSDGAVSRFNVDANRSPKAKSPGTTNFATALSPSLIGRPFAASPKPSPEGSTVSTPMTPRSTFVASSCGAPSPSAGGSPFPKPQHCNQGPKPSAYTPLTTEALVTALSSAAGRSGTLADASNSQRPDGYHVQQSNLEQLVAITNNSNNTSAAQKSNKHSRRTAQPSASNPNFRDVQTSLPWGDAPATPPRPPMMSSGLGISTESISETQEQRLRKKRGALSDLFRRKGQGGLIMDDMVKDQGGAVMSDIAHL